MAKKAVKIKDAKIDMDRVDAFNEFMIRKGAFVRVGTQLVQDPGYPYPYAQLFSEFEKTY